jgi:hypothetical protein
MPQVERWTAANGSAVLEQQLHLDVLANCGAETPQRKTDAVIAGSMETTKSLNCIQLSVILDP